MNTWNTDTEIHGYTQYRTFYKAKVVAGLFCYHGFGAGYYYSSTGEKVWTNYTDASAQAKAEGVPFLYWDSFDLPPASIRIK